MKHLLSSLLVSVLVASSSTLVTKSHSIEERLYLQVRPFYKEGRNSGYMIDFIYLRLTLSDPKADIAVDYFPHIKDNTLAEVLPDSVVGSTWMDAASQLGPNFEGLHESIFHDEPGLTPFSRSVLIGDKRIETNHSKGEDKSKFYFAKQPDGRFSIMGIFSVSRDDYDVFVPISCILKANDPQVVYQHRFNPSK